MEKVDKNIYTDKEDLYNTINRVDPIEIYKALQPTNSRIHILRMY